MRIYMDLCCFNRPYDSQTQARIRIETEAKVIIQQKIKDGECELVWSAILDYECGLNPFPEQRLAILHWRDIACAIIKVDEVVLEYARWLLTHGVTEYDALHAACSVTGQADIFVTTDNRLLKRLRTAGGITAMLPQEALAFMENWYEN